MSDPISPRYTQMILDLLLVIGIILVLVACYINLKSEFIQKYRASLYSSVQARQEELYDPIFGSVRTSDGVYVPSQVRTQAALDLEANLRGISLSQANMDSLNSQLVEVGLKVDSKSNVSLMSPQELVNYHQTLDHTRTVNTQNLMHKTFERFLEKSQSAMQTFSFARLRKNHDVLEEEIEEEEEVIVTGSQVKLDRQLQKALEKQVFDNRVKLRQKILAKWLLSTLDGSLKIESRFKGRRPMGSAYLQDLIKKYSN